MNLVNLEPDNFSKTASDLLCKEFNYVEINSSDNEKCFWEKVSNATVIWTRLNHKISSDFLKKASKLKIIATPTTGLTHIDLKACNEKGIVILSLKGEVEFLEKITSTAELTIGLMLELIRHIGKANEDVIKKYAWDRDQFRGIQLSGKKLGIIGMGRLGKLVSRIAISFGMEIVYFDIKKINTDQNCKSCSTLIELLTDSDFISLHADLNDLNEKMISKKEFDVMKKSAYFINTSRGELVDEIDLLNALRTKSIAGAAIDVISNENLVSKDLQNHPLVNYSNNNNNLIITPHIGGASYDAMQITEFFLAEKLLNYLNET